MRIHSGKKEVYNSIEEHELDGQLWTKNYLGFSCAVMVPNFTTKLSLQIRKMEEDGNARDEANKFIISGN